MCSIVNQERMEGEDVARLLQGSLLNKVGMAMDKQILFNKKRTIEINYFRFMACSVREKYSITWSLK